MRTAARALVALALVALGLAVGVAAVLVHDLWWGLPLTALAVAATLLALPGGWWLRLPFSVGVAGGVAVLTPSRPEGDYLIAGDATGYVLLGGALVVLLTGITTVRPRRRDTAEDAGERPTVS